jgi:hypothetical protein
MELIKRILAHFLRLAQTCRQRNCLSIQADQYNRAQNNLIKSSDGTRYQKNSNMKPKFFLQISDHQQSVAPAPSRGHPHTPSSADGR